MYWIKYIIQTHKQFWCSMVGASWAKLSLTEKLVWLFFINQTIAIITIIEMIFLRK